MHDANEASTAEVSQPVSTTKPSSIASILRWIIYIPLGLLLTGLIHELTEYSLNYSRQSRSYPLWLMVLGYLFIAIPILWQDVFRYYRRAILWINNRVCPAPKVGVIIFGTIFFIVAVGGTIGELVQGRHVLTTFQVIEKCVLEVLFCLNAGWVFSQIYRGNTTDLDDDRKSSFGLRYIGGFIYFTVLKSFFPQVPSDTSSPRQHIEQSAASQPSSADSSLKSAQDELKGQRANAQIVMFIIASNAKKIQDNPPSMLDVKKWMEVHRGFYEELTSADTQRLVRGTPPEFQTAYASLTKAQLEFIRAYGRMPDSLLSAAADLVAPSDITNRKYDDIKAQVEKAKADLEACILDISAITRGY